MHPDLADIVGHRCPHGCAKGSHAASTVKKFTAAQDPGRFRKRPHEKALHTPGVIRSPRSQHHREFETPDLDAYYLSG